MKKTILIMMSMIMMVVSASAFTKEETTKTSFKVSGICDMCKKRIEKAAKTEGVKSAVWNEDSKLITVTFIPSKITLDQIEQNIAKAGYDTEKFKADEGEYKKLPQCCQYDRKDEKKQ